MNQLKKEWSRMLMRLLNLFTIFIKKDERVAMASMSTKEARKVLGEEISARLSDEELSQLIRDLEAIAKMVIKDFVEAKKIKLTT